MANIIDKELEACQTQAKWMEDADYGWESHPTVAKSKHKGTCVTFVACVLQRIGILTEGKALWHNGKGYGTGTVTGANDKMIVTYYQNPSIKSIINKITPGDIILLDDNKSGISGSGGHIFIVDHASGNDVYVWDKTNSKTKLTAHKYDNSRKVRAIVKLKTATSTTSNGNTNLRIVSQPVKRRSTCAADVIDGACKWAEAIAADNSFHYGYGKPAHHYGCYFCGTQKLKKGHMLDPEKTYCCNPFVFSAFAHGGGEPYMLDMCKKGKNSATTIFRNTNSRFRNLGKPSFSSLQKGDVLWRDNGSSCHYALYLGGNRLAEAAGGDDNVRNSNKWNNSIRVRSISSYGSFTHASRYIGTGGGIMDIPGEEGVDTGQGIDMRQAISKLWRSDNYQYVYTGEEEEQEESVSSKFTKTIQDYLNNLDLSSSTSTITTTNAIPEPEIKSEIIEVEFEHDKPKKILSGKASQLLSYPTWVEAPTIILDFNGTKIGGYGNKGDKYPNYITSMSVKKINGRINQYTLNLTYQIRPGEDPNFIDKLISKTGYTNPLKILYGDSNYPNAYYKEESAVIMDARHSEDVSSYRINYSITAISSVGVAQTSFTTFKEKVDKPSNLIYDLLYNSGSISKNLIDLFPGMRNRTLVASKGLIPTNDKVVKVGGMTNSSPLAYLSYLVACMNNNENNSTYYLSLVDNSYSEFNGSYFKINEVVSYNNQQSTDSEISSNYFVLDIGYPTDNYITNFQLCNNNYWSLVYDYAGNIPKFEYGIDDNGDLIQRKTNILYSNNKYNEASLINSTWWKQVTEFPISAKVTIKGLLSPALLMSYIKINTLFYGQKDLASGLYVVTSQEDTISGSGYSTELTLLRVAGEV